VRIRRAQLSDLPACREVCLGTGDSGADAHHLFSLPEILSDIFVAPYFEFCLEFGWVLENDQAKVVGYVLGCPDTATFESQLQDIWWPRIRAKYENIEAVTNEDRECLAFLAKPVPAPLDVSRRYPAHGHIDLLPEAQGAGWGLRMMTTMMDALKATGVSGMYLDVSAVNFRAHKFYAKLGFTEIAKDGDSVYLGISLQEAVS